MLNSAPSAAVGPARDGGNARGRLREGHRAVRRRPLLGRNHAVRIVQRRIGAHQNLPHAKPDM
jgi:hypothetical protein